MSLKNQPKSYIELTKIVQELPEISQNPNKAKFYHELLNLVDQVLVAPEDFLTLNEYFTSLEESDLQSSPNLEILAFLNLKSSTIAIKYKLLKLLEENSKNITDGEKIAFAGYLPALFNREINIEQAEEVQLIIDNLREEINSSILDEELIPAEQADIRMIYEIINFLSQPSITPATNQNETPVNSETDSAKSEPIEEEKQIDYLELDGGKPFFSPDELFKSEAYQKLLIGSGYFNLLKVIFDLNKLVGKFVKLTELKSKEAFAISKFNLTENMFHSTEIQNLFQKYKITLQFPKPHETPNIFSFNEKIIQLIKGLIEVYNYISNQLRNLESAIFSSFTHRTEIQSLKAELNSLGKFIGRLTLHSTAKINPKTGQIDENLESIEKTWINSATQLSSDLSKIIKTYLVSIESINLQTTTGSLYENIEAEAERYLVNAKVYANPLLLTSDNLDSIMTNLGLQIPRPAYLINATPVEICNTLHLIFQLLKERLTPKVQ